LYSITIFLREIIRDPVL